MYKLANLVWNMTSFQKVTALLYGKCQKHAINSHTNKKIPNPNIRGHGHSIPKLLLGCNFASACNAGTWLQIICT